MTFAFDCEFEDSDECEATDESQPKPTNESQPKPIPMPNPKPADKSQPKPIPMPTEFNHDFRRRMISVIDTKAIKLEVFTRAKQQVNIKHRKDIWNYYFTVIDTLRVILGMQLFEVENPNPKKPNLKKSDVDNIDFNKIGSEDWQLKYCNLFKREIKRLKKECAKNYIPLPKLPANPVTQMNPTSVVDYDQSDSVAAGIYQLRCNISKIIKQCIKARNVLENVKIILETPYDEKFGIEKEEYKHLRMDTIRKLVDNFEIAQHLEAVLEASKPAAGLQDETTTDCQNSPPPPSTKGATLTE